ncbi:MAG: FIST N-terminal domain-containing protein [Candidatus Omnitrophota bacterium]
MSTKVSVGINQSIDSLSAGRDACFSAKVDLQSDDISLAIVFSTINFNLNEVLHGVKRVIKNTPLVGCSAAGVITNSGNFIRSVAVMLIASSNIKPGVACVGPISFGKEKISAYQLAQTASSQTAGLKRHTFSLFADNLIDNPADLIAGLREVLGGSFPIVGGFSADDGHFGKTYQFFQDEALSYSACGILWTGNCECSFSAGHGWKPLGRPLAITDSRVNRIRAIEGKPAIKLYENYFGDKIADLKKIKLSKIALLYPLGLYVSTEDGYILRNVLAVEDDGSLICQGDIPPNSEVRLMIGTKDSLLAAAKEAATEVKANLDKKNKKAVFIIVTDSFSRYKLLGRSASQEIEIIREVFEDVPLIGFYSFGELAPLSALNFMGKSYILNESISILAIGE